MVGGSIVQVVDHKVEVLETTYFDRQWRHVPDAPDVRVGDCLWWQSFTGYLSRENEFADRNIGTCKPCDNPL